MDRIYKALAEINRRKIIFWLGQEELNVSKIVEKLELSQATVSNHLMILKKAGLVESKILGKERIYKLNREKLEIFIKELNKLFALVEINQANEIIVRR